MTPSLSTVASLLVVASSFVSSTILTPSNKWVAEKEFILPGVEDIAGTIQAPDGYVSAPLRWFGQALADGPNITIVGQNYEQIFHQLTKINPQFEDFNKQQLSAQPNTNTSLSKRQESHILCDRPNFQDAKLDRLREGIDYLRGLSGWCVVDGGKNSCNRCSCSYNSGIWMCNDHDQVTHQYMYCNDMGNRADEIWRYCGWWDRSRSSGPSGNGQWFRHDTQYSVLMAGVGRGEHC